jgi:starch phosphorylase
MMLERVRELLGAGTAFAAAIADVRRHTIFTTHTPVPAGHDAFDIVQVAECAGSSFLDDFGADAERAVALGIHPHRDPHQFHMTVLAIRLAGHVNGVAQRHGIVSRELWGDLWGDRPHADVLNDFTDFELT